MNWQSLLETEIQKFITAHKDADVAALALKKPLNPLWNYPLILEQIKAQQKARLKVPHWFDTVHPLIFPPPALVEQASSQATALYKASLFKGESFVDLTGGMGVDSWAMAQHFQSGQCVELDRDAAALLEYNFKALGLSNLIIINADAEHFVETMPPVDLVMLDPQRRDTVRKGKFKLSDCTPDIHRLLPHLLQKAKYMVLKTSPMLDITATIAALGCVSAVHVVEYQGDCKEVLYVLSADHPETVPIIAVNIDSVGAPLQRFIFTAQEEHQARARYSMPLTYLYEPAPAFQKAGGFQSMSVFYDVYKLHPHTHLYTSETLKPDFPGRIFKIHGLYAPHPGQSPLARANITLRNFPGSAETLRKKLKIKDGGEDTLLACTLENGHKMLVHGRKA